MNRPREEINYPEAYYKGEFGTFEPLRDIEYVKWLRKQMREQALYAVGLKYPIIEYTYDFDKNDYLRDDKGCRIAVKKRGKPCMPELFIRDAKHYRDLARHVFNNIIWDFQI